MDPRYYRPSSPGGRRLAQTSARASTGTFVGYDPYYNTRTYREAYPATSPRSSGERVDPYIQSSSSGSNRADPAYSLYSSRSRRPNLTDSDSSTPRRSSHTLSTNIPTRRTANAIHRSDESLSPLARSWDSRDVYVSPASTIPRHEHRRIYSVDDKGRLIDDMNASRRRDRGYRNSGLSGSYSNYTERTLDAHDEPGYSYTDAAGMYRDTEPKWRPRRGSDASRQRPLSMMEGYGPRSSRELGPPPSTRGFDKMNGAIGRSGSLRDPVRTSSLDRRSGDHDAHKDGDHYSAPKRTSGSARRPITVHQDLTDRHDVDRYDYQDDYDDRRRHGSRYEADPDVETRGFGVRTAEPELYGASSSSREDSLERRSRYPDTAYREYPEPSVEEIRREHEHRDRDLALEREIEKERRRHGRDARERERDRERDVSRESDSDRGRRDRDDERRNEHHRGSLTPTAVAGAAIVANKEPSDRESRDRRYSEGGDESRRSRKFSSSDEVPRERTYPTKDEIKSERSREPREVPDSAEAEAEYLRRVQAVKEDLERTRISSDSDRDRRHDRDNQERRRSTGEDQATSFPNPEPQHILDKTLVQEPREIEVPIKVTEKDAERDARVRIVDPPKDSVAPLKGILKQPTEKFPEDPNPVREGVAPLNKSKDIPPGARWTKIDRRLVNPEALTEAKERFEERMDCVIVLRVLTRDEIQKLADRTKEIREARDERYERERRDRRSRHRDRDRDRERDRDRHHDDNTENEYRR